MIFFRDSYTLNYKAFGFHSDHVISWPEHLQIKLDITKAATQCRLKATGLNSVQDIYTIKDQARRGSVCLKTC